MSTLGEFGAGPSQVVSLNIEPTDYPEWHTAGIEATVHLAMARGGLPCFLCSLGALSTQVESIFRGPDAGSEVAADSLDAHALSLSSVQPAYDKKESFCLLSTTCLRKQCRYFRRVAPNKSAGAALATCPSVAAKCNQHNTGGDARPACGWFRQRDWPLPLLLAIALGILQHCFVLTACL